MAIYLFHLAMSLLVYFLLAFAYFGWGRLGARCLGLALPKSIRPISYIWLGWVMVIFALQACHFFLAINLYLSFGIHGCGIILALLHFKKRVNGLTIRRKDSPSWVFILLLSLSFFWIASRAMLVPSIYDSGLYYFSIIRWLNEHPLVLGLGNLHARLANNQIYFIYVAALNFYPLFNHGHNFANGFLLMIVLTQCIRDSFILVRFARKGNHKGVLAHVASVLILPYLLFISAKSSLSSPSPDLASLLLQVVIFIHFWHLLQSRGTSRIALQTTKFILVLAACAVTVKLSNLAYGVSTALTCLWFYFRNSATSCRTFVRSLGLPLVVVVLLIAVWMVHGVGMSGYPLFPSTVARLGVKWEMPYENVQNSANWIYSWARQPETHWREVLGNWNWIHPWLKRMLEHKVDIIAPLLLAFVGALCFGVRVFVARKKAKSLAFQPLLIFCPLIVGLAFWFLMAPAPRLAGAMFWLFPTAAGAVLLVNIKTPVYRNITFLFILAFMSFPQAFWLVKHHWWIKGIPQAGFQPIPKIKYRIKTTHSGLRVYTPIHEGGQTWDLPLPATPYFNPDLKLRGGDLGSGFIIDKHHDDGH